MQIGGCDRGVIEFLRVHLRDIFAFLCITTGFPKTLLKAKLPAEKISGKESMRVLFRARRDGEGS